MKLAIIVSDFKHAYSSAQLAGCTAIVATLTAPSDEGSLVNKYLRVILVWWDLPLSKRISSDLVWWISG